MNQADGRRTQSEWQVSYSINFEMPIRYRYYIIDMIALAREKRLIKHVFLVCSSKCVLYQMTNLKYCFECLFRCGLDTKYIYNCSEEPRNKKSPCTRARPWPSPSNRHQIVDAPAGGSCVRMSAAVWMAPSPSRMSRRGCWHSIVFSAAALSDYCIRLVPPSSTNRKQTCYLLTPVAA